MANGDERLYAFCVSGRGAFPTDMLRHERARYASHAEQVIAERPGNEPKLVWLITDAHGAPNGPRWRSFRWDIDQKARPANKLERARWEEQRGKPFVPIDTAESVQQHERERVVFHLCSAMDALSKMMLAAHPDAIDHIGNCMRNVQEAFANAIER